MLQLGIIECVLYIYTSSLLRTDTDLITTISQSHNRISLYLRLFPQFSHGNHFIYNCFSTSHKDTTSFTTISQSPHGYHFFYNYFPKFHMDTTSFMTIFQTPHGYHFIYDYFSKPTRIPLSFPAPLSTIAIQYQVAIINSLMRFSK